MIINVWRCECGMSHEDPWTSCFRCDPEKRRTEAEAFRARAIEARILDVTAYDELVARTADGLVIRMRDAGMALRCRGAQSREEVVTQAMALKDENKELLAENARLRRQLERVGLTKGVAK